MPRQASTPRPAAGVARRRKSRRKRGAGVVAAVTLAVRRPAVRQQVVRLPVVRQPVVLPRRRGRGGQAAGGQGRGGGRGGQAAAPPRPADAHVLKFSSDGKFLMQIGKAGKPGDMTSTTTLNRPAGVDVDLAANEVYVADGAANRRIVVFDATTGAYKRHWGAYGAKPDDSPLRPYNPNDPPAKQFRIAELRARSRATDRSTSAIAQNNRIQVFKKDGTFVKEGVRLEGDARERLGVGHRVLERSAAADSCSSPTARTRSVFIAPSRHARRAVGSFGDGGRWPGLFYGVGSVAVDSKGNVYTGENVRGQARAEVRVRK